MKNQTAKNNVRFRTRPLSPKQRKLLGFTLARKAWQRLGTDENFEDWRHREAREATERRDAAGNIVIEGVTISEAMQMHFDELFLHFKKLAGEAALEDAAENGQEMRQLSHNISVLQRELGFSDAYLGGIIKRICHKRTWTTLAEGNAVLNALRYAQQRNNKQRTTNQEHST